MKKTLIPFIFLFIFCSISLLFFNVHAVSINTEIVQVNRDMQPVTGWWYYTERDDIIDFDEYYEGSTPNVTNGGLDSITTGVYPLSSDVFQDVFGNVSTYTNTSYNIESFTQTGINITNFDTNNSISPSNLYVPYGTGTYVRGLYDGNFTWEGQTGLDPQGWNPSEGTLYSVEVIHNFTNHNEVVEFHDQTATGSLDVAMYRDFPNSATLNFTYSMYISSLSNAIYWVCGENGGALPYTLAKMTSTYYKVYFDNGGGGADHDLYYFNGTKASTHINSWNYYKFEFNTTANWYKWLIWDNSLNNWTYFYIDAVATDNTFGFWNSQPAGIGRIKIQAAASSTSHFYIDSIDISNNNSYHYNRVRELVDRIGKYNTSIIDFNQEIQITNITLDTNNCFNNSYSIFVSDNATGDFNNWMNYLDYIGNSTRFLRANLTIYSINSTTFSYVNSIKFEYDTYFYNAPFQFCSNEYDKVLLLNQLENANEETLQTNYTFTISNNPSFTYGKMEFIFLYITNNGTQTRAHNNTETDYHEFNILLNEQQQISYRIQYSSELVNGTVNWTIYDGADSYSMYLDNYTEYSNIYDYIWSCYHCVIEYTYNDDVTLSVYKMISESEHELLFQNHSNVIQTHSNSSCNVAEFQIGSYKNANNWLIMLGIDSSQSKTDYYEGAMLEFITKNLTTFNVEDIFTISLPRQTFEMDSFQITRLRLKSELQRDNFTSFILDVKGNTAYSQTFTNLDAYQSISYTLYDSETTVLSINAKYRCKNLNSFNNTIYVEVTYIFNPHDATFTELLMLAIPSMLIMIIPSATAYIRFKRTGFFVMFLLMTLLVTAIGMIPLVIGLLVITVLVIIFLKMMKDSRGGSV